MLYYLKRQANRPFYSVKLDFQVSRGYGQHYIYYIMLSTGIEPLQVHSGTGKIINAISKSDVTELHIEHYTSISFHTNFMLT